MPCKSLVITLIPLNHLVKQAAHVLGTIRHRLLALLGVVAEERTADTLAAADASTLPAADRELVWRAYLYHYLEHRVSPGAAARLADKPLDEPIGNCGVLSLVVRSQPRLYGRGIAWLASWNPWMWDNYRYYLLGLFILAVLLALARAILRFVMITAAARATDMLNRPAGQRHCG